MKAILINSLEAGGAERVALTLANELTKRNHLIELICLEKLNIYGIDTKIKINYLTNLKRIKNNLIKILSIPLLSIRLKKLVKEKDITKIQSHLIRSNIINICARLLGSKHNCQIVNHNLIGYNKYMGIKGKIKLSIIKFFYSKADQIVYITNAMQKDFNQHINLNTKVSIIYNPHNIDKIRIEAEEKIDDFIFKDKTKYIVTFGRLIKRKKVDVIIKALVELRKEYDNLELLIIGEGKEKEKLEKLTGELEVNKYVYFLGYKSNPFKYISKCDLFVISSEREGLPNVIIEAMICGVPVISSDCFSGPREILNPSSDPLLLLKSGSEITDHGALFAVNDINGLINIVSKLLRDNDLREKIITNALKRIYDFDIKKITDQYESLLK